MPDKIEVSIDPDLADLIPGFLDNRRADVGRIAELAKSGDAAALRKIGHDLKGCGVAYGFDPISDIGARIEQCGIQNRAADAAALGQELSDYLARVVVKYG